MYGIPLVIVVMSSTTRSASLLLIAVLVCSQAMVACGGLFGMSVLEEGMCAQHVLPQSALPLVCSLC